MKKTLSFHLPLSIITLVTGISWSTRAEALSGYLNTFIGIYETANTVLDSCTTCHVNANNFSRNPYGRAMGGRLDMGDTVTQALRNIESLDSDGDTFSNIEEIQALAHPGDPSVFPMTSEPDIDVLPLTLAFGAVLSGTTATLTTSISNRGTAELTVSDLVITGSSGFTLAPGTTSPLTVTPGTSTDVAVNYTPSGAGNDNGTLVISSDDPDEPQLAVALSGNGQTPVAECDIDVNPLKLEFQGVAVGSSKTLSVTLSNTGSVDCNVNSLSVAGSTNFTLSQENPAVPFALKMGETANVSVDYSPSDTGDDTGILEISSDDPDEPLISVDLSASATQNGQVVDLDIRKFKVSRVYKVTRRKPIRVYLKVVNRGTIDEPRLATVVGVQNDQEVYRETLMVFDGLRKGKTRFFLPSFKPTEAGEILWRATIDDDDPDVDEAMASTVVKDKRARRRRHEDRDEDDDRDHGDEGDEDEDRDRDEDRNRDENRDEDKDHDDDRDDDEDWNERGYRGT